MELVMIEQTAVRAAKEAGGMVTDTRGAAYHLGVRNIAATNGRVHEELLLTLREAQAMGYEG